MPTRSEDSFNSNIENIDADPEWLEYIGESYSHAIGHNSTDFAPREYLEFRKDRLVALGLDPENKAHWQILTESLSELERIALSVRATGFPDTNRQEADVALANKELMSWLQSLLGQ